MHRQRSGTAAASEELNKVDTAPTAGREIIGELYWQNV